MIPTPYHFRGLDLEAGLNPDVRAEIEAARSRAKVLATAEPDSRKRGILRWPRMFWPTGTRVVTQ